MSPSERKVESALCKYKALLLTSSKPCLSLLSVLAEDMEIEEDQEAHAHRVARDRAPEASRRTVNLKVSEGRQPSAIPAGLKIVNTFYVYDDEHGEQSQEDIGASRRTQSEPPLRLLSSDAQQPRCSGRIQSAPASPVGVGDVGMLAVETRNTCKHKQAQQCAQQAHRPVLLGRLTSSSAESRTTVYLKNLPCFYNQKLLMGMLESRGLADPWDFLYVPVDMRTLKSMGYGFINFCDSSTAQAFRSAFDGFKAWPYPSNKVLSVVWSRSQGYSSNVKKAKAKQIPEAFRPVLRPGKVHLKDSLFP